MNEMIPLALVLAAGCLIGFIFYGGLLWTVEKGLLSKHPALWFFCSFWLRMGFVAVAFFEVAGVEWKRVLICFAGFLVGRIVVSWFAQRRIHAN